MLHACRPPNNKQPTSWFYVVVHSVRVVADTSSKGRHALPLPLPRIWPRARRTTTKAHHAAACAWCMHALHAAPPAPACMHTHARTNEPNGFLFLLSLLDEQARKQPASDAGTPLRPTNTHARIGRDDDTGLCLDTTRATHQNRQLNFYGVCGGIVVFVHNCEPDVNIR